jgi:hypothetical protein
VAAAALLGSCETKVVIEPALRELEQLVVPESPERGSREEVQLGLNDQK